MLSELMLAQEFNSPHPGWETGIPALLILPFLCLYDVSPESEQKAVGSPHDSLNTVTPMAHPAWMATGVTLGSRVQEDHGDNALWQPVLASQQRGRFQPSSRSLLTAEAG